MSDEAVIYKTADELLEEKKAPDHMVPEIKVLLSKALEKAENKNYREAYEFINLAGNLIKKLEGFRYRPETRTLFDDIITDYEILKECVERGLGKVN